MAAAVVVVLGTVATAALQDQLCMVFAMFEVARLRRLRISLLACGSGHRKRLDP